MGTVESTSKGNISKTLLALYKDFKKRALLSAVTEINQRPTFLYPSLKIRSKAPRRSSRSPSPFSENANASELEAVPIPHAPQLELELPEPNEHAQSGVDAFLRKLKDDFGLSAPQMKTIEQYIQTNGMAYIEEKIAVVNSEARPNAARAFLAALKCDWKLPVNRKPPKRKSQPPAQELPPEMSAEEWEKKREKTRVIFDEFKKSLRGEPRDGAVPVGE